MDSNSNDGQINVDLFERNSSRRRRHSAVEKRTLTVIAKCPEDGLYYLGKLIKDGNPSKVFFPSNNGVNKSRIERLIPRDDVIPYAGSTSCPILQIWDYVLVKIACEGSKKSPVFPGKIVGLPLENALNHEKFYSVLVYTDKVITKRRRDIIKVTEGLYDRLIMALRDRHQHKLSPQDIQGNGQRCVSEELTFPPVGMVTTPDMTPISSRRPSIITKKNGKHRGVQTDKERADKSQQTTARENKAINTEDEEPKDPKVVGPPLPPPPKDPSPVIGEEVLARWSDDGWYYFGTVYSLSVSEHESGGRVFTVKDATGHTENIVEKNLFWDKKRAHLLKHNSIKKHDCVIANHPDFPHSYAPGQIKKISRDHIARVRFYDNKVADVDTAYVYVMTKEKYEEDVDYIEECQKRGKRAVIARDNKTGIYHTGTILNQDEVGHMAQIKFTNGEEISQDIRHIFEKQTTTRAEADYHFVLAPVQGDSDQRTYLPAKVTGSELFVILNVEICDNTRAMRNLSDCFYINNEYYLNAVNYYNAYTNRNRAAFQHQHQPVISRNDSGEVTDTEQLNEAAEPVSVNAENSQRTSLQLESRQIVNRTPEIVTGLSTSPLRQGRRWESLVRKSGSLKYGIDRETKVESRVEIIITCVKSKKTIHETPEGIEEDDKFVI